MIYAAEDETSKEKQNIIQARFKASTKHEQRTTSQLRHLKQRASNAQAYMHR